MSVNADPPWGVDAGHIHGGVPVVGRRALLRPPMPADYEWLYATACLPKVSFGWRLRGVIPSFDAFISLLFQQSDAQHMICRRDSGERAGLVQLFGYQHRDGYAHLSVFFDPAVQALGWPFEGVLLFINYCFTAWPIRKIYLESPRPVFETFASGASDLFEVEGQLKDHEFYHGQFVDKVIGAVYRSTWESQKTLLHRLTNTDG